MAIYQLENPVTFNTVEEAIEAIRQGEVIIIADDEDRENEGDFVCAAEKVTPEIINFMISHGKGLVCLSLASELCETLDLPLMIPGNPMDLETAAFTVTIDAQPAFGCQTGISATDRANTIRRAVHPDAQPIDFRRPGHVFPLRARPRGVLERTGQTEASVDIAKLADLTPAGVLCEVLNADGEPARRNELFAIAKKFNLKLITVEQLVNYRKASQPLTELICPQ